MNIFDFDFMKGFIRMTEDAWLKGWHERNGGNLSYRMKPEEVTDAKDFFDYSSEFVPLGVTVPNLAGEHFLLTGSGKYFRNIVLCPEDNLAVTEIDEKGQNYRIVWGLAHGGRPTSELPTHMMNHSIKKEITCNRHRVILHCHTPNLIALTFILPLDDKVFTRALWEMITECPVVFPEGVGVASWMVPGGKAIAEATSVLMKKYNIAIWAHHGTFSSGEDFDITFGLMDTVEKAAEILVKVMSMGGAKQKMTDKNLRDLADEFKVTLPEEFMSE